MAKKKNIDSKIFDLDKGIAYLLATEDEMMVDLANIFNEEKESPTEEELTQLLAFFLVFSVGFGKMNLNSISAKFTKRANWFIGVLPVLGMESGKRRNYVRERWEPMMLNRIINKATAIAAYKAAGPVNMYENK